MITTTEVSAKDTAVLTNTIANSAKAPIQARPAPQNGTNHNHHETIPKSPIIQETKPMIPNKNNPKHSSLPTPIKIEQLQVWIKGYHLDSYLVEGFTSGFRLGFMGERLSSTSKNLKSCEELPTEVIKKLQVELSYDRIAGPFDSPLLSTFELVLSD